MISWSAWEQIFCRFSDSNDNLAEMQAMVIWQIQFSEFDLFLAHFKDVPGAKIGLICHIEHRLIQMQMRKQKRETEREKNTSKLKRILINSFAMTLTSFALTPDEWEQEKKNCDWRKNETFPEQNKKGKLQKKRNEVKLWNMEKCVE